MDGFATQLPESRKIGIEFDSVSLVVSNGRKGKRHIVKGVSGKFKSGELTAIMGPSGAGKTTLLNILTGFQTKDVTGTIRHVNSSSKKKGAEQYKKDSCYILQDDQLPLLFTVNEIMNMASQLKIGPNIVEKSRQFAIDEILESLNLTKCKNTRCSFLSGGQKKRLSIALELIDNPQVMFLDEPTTGLDSLSSFQCISILKKLSKEGRTIVCTIHQPSASIFELFDHVYAMAEGRCIYQGSSDNTLYFLAYLGLRCPEYHNPADYLLEVASGEYGNFTNELSKVAQEINWRNSSITSLSNVDGIQKPALKCLLNDCLNGKPAALVPSEWSKFLVLLYRSCLHLHRDWTVTHLKLVMHLLMGAVIGIVYFNAGNDASKTISNFGYLLITLVYLSYTSMMPAVLRFPNEIPILRKERFNNWYKLKTYYLAFMVVGIPVQLLFCASYTTISYLISTQPMEWGRYFMFLNICCLVTLTAESVGIVLGTTVNPINGTFLGAILLALMLTLAGFLVLLTHMSKAFYYFSHISFIRYGIQGLVYALYGNERAAIPCPNDVDYCHYKKPDIFLKEIGMADENLYWISTVALIVIIVSLRLVGFCTLKSSLSRG